MYVQECTMEQESIRGDRCFLNICLYIGAVLPTRSYIVHLRQKGYLLQLLHFRSWKRKYVPNSANIT